MSATKSTFAYVIITLSLGTLLTACGNDNSAGNTGSGIQVSEGGRQIISDSNANAFVTCNTNAAYQQQSYQSQSGNNRMINIVYQGGMTGNNGNYQYQQQQYQQPSSGYYSNPYTPSTGSNGSHYGNNSGGYQQVSLMIMQGSNNSYNYSNQQQQYGQNYNNGSYYPQTSQQNQSGYYVASLQVSGLQAPVSPAQCSVTSLNETTSMITGSVTCQAAWQGGEQVTLSFGCQRR